MDGHSISGRIPTLVAPPLSLDAIDAKGEQFFHRYRQMRPADHVFVHGLNFTDVYERLILPTYGVVLQEGIPLGNLPDGRKLLGSYSVTRNLAAIDPCLSAPLQDPRRTFTLWHEVCGHGVLQGAFLRRQLSPTCSDAVLEDTEFTLSDKVATLLEVQANRFAAAVGAPLWFVDRAIVYRLRPPTPLVYWGAGEYAFDVLNGGRRRYYADSFLSYCGAVAHCIKPLFGGLSAQAISYQVAKSLIVSDRAGSGSRSDLRLFRVARAPEVTRIQKLRAEVADFSISPALLRAEESELASGTAV